MQRLRKLFRPVFFMVMIAMASCGTNPPVSSAPDAAKPIATEISATTGPETVVSPMTQAPETASRDVYIIQPGDVLSISVWKEKDLQGEMAVRPDGRLNFPLAGEVDAAGKTIEQLKTEIAAKLAKYVPDPVITADVKQSQGNKIYVVGKVYKPGEFASNRSIDVMQALSMAGGPNPFAAVNKIKILRRVNGELKSIPFKYSRVEKGQDLEQNIILQGGDVVVVP